MYKSGGSSQVTLPDTPIPNVQHEFNGSVKTVQVQVVTERQQFRPVETARALKAISLKKHEEVDATIKAFRKNTQRRIRRWRDENAPQNSGLLNSLSTEFGPSKDSFAPKLQPSVHKEVAQQAKPESPVQITDSPGQARMHLLRYAETRKAVESLAQRKLSGSMVDPNTTKQSLNLGVSAVEPSQSTFVGRDKYNERVLFALRQAHVRKLESEMGRRVAHKKKEAADELRRIKKDVLERKERIQTTQEAQLQAAQRPSSEPTPALDQKTVESHPAKKKSREESVRYITALEDRLRRKAEARNIQLPNLCNCDHGKAYRGTKPVWERCANDCVFHNNPQAYARALGDIFRSLEQ